MNKAQKRARENNIRYWKDRAMQRELEAQVKASKYLARMDQAIREAQQDILRQIESFYARYAVENKVTLAEARKYLTAKELSDFKNIDLKRFRELALLDNPEYKRILDATSYRVRISRLEALNLTMEMRMAELYGGLNGMQQIAYTGLADIYQGAYYKTMYDIQRTGAAAGTVKAIADKTMQEILSYNWSGREFKSRIWGHQEATRKAIRQELQRSFAVGRPIRQTSKVISERTGVAYSRAEALVRTEASFFHGYAAQQSYIETDLDRYQILATLDSRTSETCREEDGKIYNTKDFEAGKNAPPFHTRCRSTTIPYFDESKYMQNEKRQSAVGIVENMPYEEWYKKYVS